MNDCETKQIPVRSELVRRSRIVPTLVLYDGDEIGGVQRLSKDLTIIGRTPECDVILTESKVSRQHARIVRQTVEGAGPEDSLECFRLQDLDSTNGTFLNGNPIDSALLQDGDKFSIGESVLKFAYLDEQDLSFQARIVEMIHIDDLTGLLTKRSLYRALEKELMRAGRYHRPISVLMMDLDHFKQVNDTKGHIIGSHCLQEVGKLIRETTRSIDVNGRYGGEEFVSYLPETDGPDALRLAERVRLAMEARTFEHNGIEYQITISIGVSVFPDHGRTVEELVQTADDCLYQAKRTGRNRSILAELPADDGESSPG